MPNYDIPNGVVAVIAACVALVSVCVTCLVWQQYRPKVVAWEGRPVRFANGHVSNKERPLQIVWENVVYDCTKSDDQGNSK